MKLSALKCPACGASVNIDENQSFFKCEYCQSKINIIKPVSIGNSVYEGLTELEKTKMENYLTILEQSMIAGNYSEAYSYCNKALEINPKIAQIWENKAICCFWLSSINDLENEKINEILTYLNTSKRLEPDSSTFIETCKNIAINLNYIVLYLHNNLQYDQVNSTGRATSYSINAKEKVISYISLLETCYELDDNIMYLENALKILVKGKIRWMESGYNLSDAREVMFNAIKKYEILCAKIKEKNPDYISPYITTNSPTNYKLVLVVIIGFIILITILSILQKK